MDLRFIQLMVQLILSGPLALLLTFYVYPPLFKFAGIQSPEDPFTPIYSTMCVLNFAAITGFPFLNLRNSGRAVVGMIVVSFCVLITLPLRNPTLGGGWGDPWIIVNVVIGTACVLCYDYLTERSSHV